MRRMIIYSWEEVPEITISKTLQAMSIQNSYTNPKREIPAVRQKTLSYKHITESDETGSDETGSDETESEDDSSSEEEPENNISAALQARSMHNYSDGKPTRGKLVPQKTLNYQETENEDDEGEDDDDVVGIDGEAAVSFEWGDREGSGVETMNHFSHPHPLYQFKLKKIDNTKCNMCNQLIDGFAFGCEPCDFFICKGNGCLGIKSQIQHKSHPDDHPLHFHFPSLHNTCDACHSPTNTAFYRCDICDYDLHCDCAHTSSFCKMPVFMFDKKGNKVQLYYSLPDGAGVRCSECKAGIPKTDWVFYNKKKGYTYHFKCLPKPEKHEVHPRFFRGLMRFLIRRKSRSRH